MNFKVTLKNNGTNVLENAHKIQKELNLDLRFIKEGTGNSFTNPSIIGNGNEKDINTFLKTLEEKRMIFANTAYTWG